MTVLAAGAIAMPLRAEQVMDPATQDADQFGFSVSSHGDLVVVGARAATYIASPGETGAPYGKVFIYRRAPDGLLTLEQSFFAPNFVQEAMDMGFGCSVSTDGERIAVGSHQIDAGGMSSAGKVFMYRESSPGIWALEQAIAANDPQTNSDFGWSVSIEGDRLAVGCRRNSLGVSGSTIPPATSRNHGSVYVFHRTEGSGWSQVAKLTAATPVTEARLGFSVALSGDTIIAGAPRDATVTTSSATISTSRLGTAYAFRWNGTAWSQEQKFWGTGGFRKGIANSNEDWFGRSVDVEGRFAVVGAPGVDNASGNAAGADSGNVGGAWIFERNDATGVWTQRANLTRTAPSAGDIHGFSVSIEGDLVLVGAPGDNPTGNGSVAYNRSTFDYDGITGQGSIRAWRRTAATTWTAVSADPIVSSHPGAGKTFAFSVDHEDGFIHAGALYGGGTFVNEQGVPVTAGAMITLPFGFFDCDLDGITDAGAVPDLDGDGIADCNDLNRDGDRVDNASDACPDDPSQVVAGPCGCSPPGPDSDGDGTPDCVDGCPSDPLKTAPGTCGCGAPEAGPPGYWRDQDGDGSGDAAQPATTCSLEGFVTNSLDCDDSSASRRPDAPELCADAGIDNDCDGDTADVDANPTDGTDFYPDSDGDSFGAGPPRRECSAPTGHAANALDCDDAASSIYPNAPESCSDLGVDNDCDADAMDFDASDPAVRPYYVDSDGDGYTHPDPRPACSQPADHLLSPSVPTDCDDASSGTSPAAMERCGDTGLDNDCDGDAADIDADADDRQLFFPDVDSDGFGSGPDGQWACSQPAGHVTDGRDCDDATPSVHPGAAELCANDVVDNDCDGTSNDIDDDASDRLTFHRDADHDGFGRGGETILACAMPPGYTDNQFDCDDESAGVFPGAGESCSDAGVDNDCDGDPVEVDPDAADLSTFHSDLDLDGFGTDAQIQSACWPSAGFVPTSGDCDDTNASVMPGGPELCATVGLDNDCDGAVDDVDGSEPDADSDGTADCIDGCPADAAKLAPGICGCGVADDDSDADATPDCLDACPLDAAKTVPGTCGCGVADVDADADGVLDCLLPESVAALATLAPSGLATGDDFGAAVAIGPALAAIGAPFDDLPGKVDAGSVRIFARSGGTWSEATTLVAPDAVLKDRFGTAISLSGDALLVGAPFADMAGAADAGAAYLFRRAGTAWSFERKFTRATPAAGDRFGWAVAVRGDLVAIGSPLANRAGLADSGEVSIFRRVGTEWVATATVGSLPVTASDQCGVSVSLGGPPEAPVLAAGAPGDDETGKLNCGAIYAFTCGTDGSVTGSTRLVAGPSIAAAGLGASVTVDSSGARIAAGAPLADFTGMTDRGAISVWQRAGSSWSASSPTHPYLSAGDRFGASVAWGTDDACLVVGAPNDAVGGLVNRGSVAVLSRRGDGSFQLHDLLVLPASGTSPSLFGTSVASGDAGLVVGAPKHLPPAGGTARLFAAPSPCAGIDSDSDGTDDCTDADDDNDGTADGSDACGRDPSKIAPGACGCGVADTDSDADGTADCHDLCPGDPAKVTPGPCGCGAADTDSDADGTADCEDDCPTDPAKIAPGTCGCGVPETGDTDEDGIADCLDEDDDGDGTGDGSDGCPVDAGKTAPGQCGCGVTDLDSDADGVADCNDGCPTDAGKTAPGTCGCGVADADADADGLVDCLGGGTLAETAGLTAAGLAAGDDFGAAVAADGDVVVVGLPLDDLPGKVDAGSARVYRRTGGLWSQEAQLLAPAAVAKARDYFGSSVAVRGDVIVVGSPSSDTDGLLDAGAAFIYRRSGGTWDLESSLSGTNPAATDRFGFSVAVRGDLVVAGSPQSDPDGQVDAGEITIFRRTADLWIPAEVVVSEPAVAGNRLGHAVSLGGNEATPILAAGLPGLDLPGKLNCGGAIILTLDADGTATSTTTTVAVPPLARSALGTAIAIDEAGSTVAAGGPLGDRPSIGTDSGIVTIWSLVNDDWVATDLVPPDHGAGERYGTSMAFASDGDSVAIGSPYDTVSNIPQRGSVAVFRRQAASWSMFDRLVITGGATASRFGTAVAGSDGSFAVGAPKHGPPAGGAVRLFATPPPSSP